MQGKGPDSETCNVCGEVRPRRELGIERHKRTIPGTNRKVEEVVRYCRDKAECTAAAPKFTFMASKRTPATATRRTRPVGE